MDMLSRCRKRHTTTSPETKRRSPRTAQIKAAGAKKPVDERQSGTDKCLSNIDNAVPAITESQNGSINLRILAKPGAKQSAITDIAEDYIGVQIAAPARESEANIELVNYLASILEFRKTNITVVKGLRSQIKSVSVSKNGLTIDRVKNLIEQQLSKDIQ